MATTSQDCVQVSDDLMRLLDGELDAVGVEALNAHFRGCAGCSRFYQSLREQLVLHQWAEADGFDLDDAEDCLPGDIPDYRDLADRLRDADLGGLGRLLYEILKAEFLFDYGDGIAAAEAPIDDPHAERRRGADMVDELRDWHDADEVDGVDLLEVARRLHPPSMNDDRLSQLVAGMGVVARLAPDLRLAATYYQALAHVKGGREAAATERLRVIVDVGASPLLRSAQVALATLPALLGGRPAESIAALEACLVGDAVDPIVRYNLAKAHFIRAGGRLDAEGAQHLEAARSAAGPIIDHQLALPSEGPLREAWRAYRAQSTSRRTSVSS